MNNKVKKSDLKNYKGLIIYLINKGLVFKGYNLKNRKNLKFVMQNLLNEVENGNLEFDRFNGLKNCIANHTKRIVNDFFKMLTGKCKSEIDSLTYFIEYERYAIN